MLKDKAAATAQYGRKAVDTLIESWSVGDILWGKGEDGIITNVRPTYQNAPLVRVGKVTASNDGKLDIEVDIMLLARADAHPASVGRRWSWMMGE